MRSNGAPTRFAIVADLRTGSTLLSTSLDQHPGIRCRGELLHPDDLPDNQLPGIRRKELAPNQLLEAAFAVSRESAIGFRAMVFRPDPAQQPDWAGFWDELRAWKEVRVLFLERRDRLAQYASLCIAQQTGKFHPPPGDPTLRPENRPRLHIDPQAFRSWADERQQLRARRKAQLQGVPLLDLAYEELAANWDATLQAIQQFLCVEARTLRPAKERQEQRPLELVIANYDELRRVADRLPPGQNPRSTQDPTEYFLAEDLGRG